MTIKEIIILVLVVSVLLLVLGYGLKATVAEAFYLFRHPRKLFRTLLAMNVLMPLFVIMLVSLFHFEPLIRVTLFALAISPVPPLFPGTISKASEHEEYIIGLLVAASLFSFLLIPFSLALLEAVVNRPLHTSLRSIIISILITVVFPMFIGISIRHFAPSFAGRIAEPVKKTGMVLLLLALLPLVVVMFPSIWQLIGNGTALAFLAFIVVGSIVGHLLGGPAEQDRGILAVATSSRHPGIAIAIASANLQVHDMVPAAVVLYLLLSILTTILYLKWLAHQKPSPPLTHPNT
ncbi:hypothetical protein [Pontibacter ruber]|uniref:Na+-dependent transporter n=1 Tax=Pontibacter ruber TaxID=1343895 RepID=A0ABW5CYR3_9BACT|nr:hypothetical protein [Pontibacter ruber]